MEGELADDPHRERHWDLASSVGATATAVAASRAMASQGPDPLLADPWLEHLTVDYDEEQRWISIGRGGLRIACNLGTDPATVPVTGDVVLAWGEPKVGTDGTVLDGHSFAILRCG